MSLGAFIAAIRGRTRSLAAEKRDVPDAVGAVAPGLLTLGGLV